MIIEQNIGFNNMIYSLCFYTILSVVGITHVQSSNGMSQRETAAVKSGVMRRDVRHSVSCLLALPTLPQDIKGKVQALKARLEGQDINSPQLLLPQAQEIQTLLLASTSASEKAKGYANSIVNDISYAAQL